VAGLDDLNDDGLECVAFEQTLELVQLYQIIGRARMRSKPVFVLVELHQKRERHVFEREFDRAQTRAPGHRVEAVFNFVVVVEAA
jgi:hypothetical protein